jgi:hypothetical protein
MPARAASTASSDTTAALWTPLRCGLLLRRVELRGASGLRRMRHRQVLSLRLRVRASLFLGDIHRSHLTGGLYDLSQRILVRQDEPDYRAEMPCWILLPGELVRGEGLSAWKFNNLVG